MVVSIPDSFATPVTLASTPSGLAANGGSSGGDQQSAGTFGDQLQQALQSSSPGTSPADAAPADQLQLSDSSPDATGSRAPAAGSSCWEQRQVGCAGQFCAGQCCRQFGFSNRKRRQQRPPSSANGTTGNTRLSAGQRPNRHRPPALPAAMPRSNRRQRNGKRLWQSVRRSRRKRIQRPKPPPRPMRRRRTSGRRAPLGNLLKL